MQPDKKQETIVVTIDLITYEADGYTVARVFDGKGQRFCATIKGTAHVGQRLSLTGVWFQHPDWGRQFKSYAHHEVPPITQDGIAAWLSGNAEIKGVGPVKAAALVAVYPTQWDQAIRNQDCRKIMAKRAKVKAAIVDQIAEIWEKNTAIASMQAWFHGFGLTPNQVNKIISLWGLDAVGEMQENPYALIGQIRGFGFQRADVVARKMGIKRDDPNRAEACIIYLLEQELSQGHTFSYGYDLEKWALTALELDAPEERTIVKKSIEHMIGVNSLKETEIQGKTAICLPQAWGAESYVWEMLRNAPKNPLDFHVDTYSLTDDQKAAVAVLGQSRNAILTGPAGTGKTTTARCIAKGAVAAGLTVSLCAPTGKAALRLQEKTGMPAVTIHKLLGYDGQEFNAQHPLSCDLLIVDEFSMVDIFLFRQLLLHIDLSRTALLLIGDHHQLPPVGPGNPMRDLVELSVKGKPLIPVANLTQIQRHAGLIPRNAGRILTQRHCPGGVTGDKSWLIMCPNDPDPDGTWALIHFFLRAATRDYAEPAADFQVITPRRTGSMLSVDSLNFLIQAYYQDYFYGIDSTKYPPGTILRGDRIICRKNQRGTGARNGSMGFCHHVHKDGMLQVRYDDMLGKIIDYPPDSEGIDDIHLGYALTIHQVQGSEWPHVCVVVSNKHSFMLNRNMLYTAVTRAQDRVTLIGQKSTLDYAADKDSADKRRTLLAEFQLNYESIDFVDNTTT